MIKKRIYQTIITLLLLIASIVLFVNSDHKVKHQDISYEAVKATIISAESKKVSGRYTYNVVVEYEGTQYNLINVQSGEMPKYEGLANLDADLQHDNPYFDNTVYYSKGKMYSNIAGIRTDSKSFNWQMVGLIGVCIFGMLHLMCLIDVIDKKRKG